MTEKQAASLTGRARYARVLSHCRDISLGFGKTQLSELMENAGAALLEFAERAESNRMQGRFFEAMGLIQRGKPKIEHDFGAALAEGFDQLGNPEPSLSVLHAQTDEHDAIELSLVEPDEMEESVAVENLIIRANADFFSELFVLSQRFAVINDGRELKEYEIPVGPSHLVHSFRRAIATIEIEARIKVILYALFDRFVVKRAKGLYDQLNDNLKAAEILPNIRPSQIRPERRVVSRSKRSAPWEEGNSRKTEKERSGRTEPVSPQTPSLGTQLFDSIIALMSDRHSDTQGAERRPAGSSISLDPAVSAAEARQLVSAIHELQSQSTTASVSELMANSGKSGSLETSVEFLERIRATLNQEREQVLLQIDREKLSPVDADLIDLIGMLFQYMLNDAVLPNLAKALLSHLHTPYLKVAIVDRRLLTDSGHPARRLLDQMVEAGSLWVDEQNPRPGIFPAMQRVVDRVLHDFTDDVSLFDELVSEFESAMGEQRRRTDTMEQRTREGVRGREKLALAKRRANHELQRLIQDNRLPHTVVTFLSHTWLDLMVFILLREKLGDRSDAWRQAIETVVALAALFKPKETSAERQTRGGTAAKIRGRILASVQSMGSYNRPALDALFTLLETPEAWDREWMSSVIESPAEIRDDKRLTRSYSPESKSSGAVAVEITEREQEVIRRLRKLKLGTWFEVRSDSDESPRRIKLSWLSPLTATCMFVDRSGLQAEIKTLQELAQEILSGRAKVIPRPKHPFIERALVSIRNMLQRSDGNPSAAT